LSDWWLADTPLFITGTFRDRSLLSSFSQRPRIEFTPRIFPFHHRFESADKVGSKIERATEAEAKRELLCLRIEKCRYPEI
jgi:hypothetical protein